MATVYISKIEPKEIIKGFKGKFIHTENTTPAFWEVEKGASIPLHSQILCHQTSIRDLPQKPIVKWNRSSAEQRALLPFVWLSNSSHQQRFCYLLLNISKYYYNKTLRPHGNPPFTLTEIFSLPFIASRHLIGSLSAPSPY